MPFPPTSLQTPPPQTPRADAAWEPQDTSPRRAASPFAAVPSPCRPRRVGRARSRRPPPLCPTGLSHPPAQQIRLRKGRQKPPSTSRFPARAASPLKTRTRRTPLKKPQQRAWLCPGTSRVPEHLAPPKSPPTLFTWRTTTPTVQLMQMLSKTSPFQLGLFLSGRGGLRHHLDGASCARSWDAGAIAQPSVPSPAVPCT